MRAARVGQTEQFRALVERLAGGIVTGVTEQRVVTEPARFDQHRMATGHEQREVRESRWVGLEQRREQVTLEVMDADGRQSPGEGQRPRERGARQQRADQARADGVRHAIEFICAGTGFGQGPLDQRQQALHMVARGQFRDHPAIGLVQIHLGVQHMRQQAAAVIEDGDGRFVAGGFEGEDAHGEGQILPFGSGVIRLLDPAAAGSWGGRFDFPF